MLLRPDWVVISQGSENSKVPSHEISRCARVQLSIWQPGGGGGNNGSVSNRRPARESTPSLPGTNGGGGIKLTDQKRSREHLGVVGTFPAAVLERRSQPKDVLLRRGKGSEVKQGGHTAVLLANGAFVRDRFKLRQRSQPSTLLNT